MPESARITEGPGILRLIGNTPIVEIRRLRESIRPEVRLFAKLEGFNPAGSV